MNDESRTSNELTGSFLFSPGVFKREEDQRLAHDAIALQCRSR
jgi:hypothetical protein